MNNLNIRQFQKQLFAWYAPNMRSLPWRDTSDPYRIWISEVMLQQTQVKTVIPFYQRFLLRFPDVFQLAGADLEEVLKVWEGLGYYARARNLHKAADVIVKRHGGTVPDEFKSFRRLPGVGDYIASAVLSIGYGKPHAVVDGNVKRVLSRLNKINIPVTGALSGKIFKDAADKLLAIDDPGNHNQAMMELGSLVCTPQTPGCMKCPVKRFCRAFLTHEVDQFPKKIKKPAIPQFHIATGVVCKGKEILITRRKLEGLLGGLWEFPGGKVHEGETAELACVREIKEEVNLNVQTEQHITQVRHAYTHFKIIMDVFRCTYVDGRIRLKGPIDFQWIRLNQIRDYPFPGANHKIFPYLKENLK